MGRVHSAVVATLVVLAPIHTAFAQQGPYAPVGPPPPAEPPPPAAYYAPPEPVPPSTPRHERAREDDHVVVILGASWFQGLGGAYGASVGAYVTPHTVIEVDAYRAVSIVPRQRSDGVGLHVRQFAGDVAYLRLGARFRHMEASRRIDSNELSERQVQNDMGADFATGMRWQFGHWVVGVDYFALYVPIGRFSTEEQIVDPRNGELLAAEPVDLNLRPDVRLAAAYLGVSF